MNAHDRAASGNDAPSTVRGRFHDRDAVAAAIDGLTDAKIPEDQIDVWVESPDGGRHPIPVKERMGALTGAVTGAVVGAVVAVVAVLVLGTRVIPVSEGSAVPVLWMGAVQAAGAGAVVGVVIGGVLGQGRWQGRKDMDPEAVRAGGAVVAVRGAAFEAKARRVLEAAGAHELTVG